MRAQQLLQRGVLLGVAVPLLMTIGCASIVGGSTQTVNVDTRTVGGDVVTGAKCRLANSKGTWYLTTPGHATVHRAYGDLSISCEKGGQTFGNTVASSSVRGWMFGNLLFGGLIGVGIDIGTGAGYGYNQRLQVTSESPRISGTDVAAQPADESGAVRTSPVSAPSVITMADDIVPDGERALPAVKRDVTSGVATMVAAHADWDRLCKSEGPMPKIALLTTTLHGTLEIKQGEFTAPDARAAASCADGHVYGTQIVYRSNPGFHGADHLRYEVSGEAGQFTRVIDIAVN